MNINFVDIVLWFCLFMFGAVCASAINCAVYRIHRKMDWVRGRSVCEQCDRVLNWWEIIPVFSALFLRGTCPTCHTYFGYKHTLTETACGIAFILTAYVDHYVSIFMKIYIFMLILLWFTVLSLVLDRKF